MTASAAGPASPASPEIGRLRMAELMACLAAACELAMGQEADFALHSTALAMRIGAAQRLAASEMRDLYYLAQLRYLGCNADNQRMADIVGDVIALRRAVAPLDMGDAPAMLAALWARLRERHEAAPLAMLGGLLQWLRESGAIFPGHCEAAERLGTRLGFGASLVAALGQLYVRWDGKGTPRLAGEAILPAVRIVGLAQDTITHARRGGWPAVLALLQQRSGRQYDPRLVALLLALGPALLDDLPRDWVALLNLEPAPQQQLQGPALDAALHAMADYADLQTGTGLGHARRVAGLARAAAAGLGLADEWQLALLQAGLLHDIGRVAISADVWCQPGPLSAGQ